MLLAGHITLIQACTQDGISEWNRSETKWQECALEPQQNGVLGTQN